MSECTFTLNHRSKNSNASADVPVRLPILAIAEDFDLNYRTADPSGLAVYFVGVKKIHSLKLRTSSSLGLGRLANASGGHVNALGGLEEDSFLAGKGWGGVARAQRWIAAMAGGSFEIHDRGGGSSSMISGDSGVPSTYDLCVPIRRVIHRT